MKQLAIFFLAFAAFTLSAEVIYQNDFSMRTSANSIPRGTWLTKHYAYPAPLCYSYGTSSSFTPSAPYSNLERVQDGWFRIVGNPENSSKINFWTRLPEGGVNPVAAISNQSDQRAQDQVAMVVHPLANEFSNGVLRVSVDMRPPDEWKNAAYFRLMPVFRDKLSAASTSYAPYALAFGLQNQGSKAEPLLNISVVGSNGSWDNPATKSNTATNGPVEVGHWYRLVAELNLDKSTYCFWAYDMGTNQPELTTPTPSRPFGNYFVSGYDPISGLTHGDKYLYRSVALNGPVCGLALRMENAANYSISTDKTLVINNAPQVDNLSVGWKAPGEDGFASCYENDFAIRRYRTLSGGTAAFDCANALTVPEADVFSYGVSVAKGASNDELVKPVLCRAMVSDATEPGRDGWVMTGKSLSSGFYNAIVSTGESGGRVLAFVKASADKEASPYVKLAHAVGRKIGSGTVLAVCDIKTPSKWAGSSRSATLCLGADGLAQNDSTDSLGARCGIGGLSADASGINCYPYVYEAETKTKQDVPLASNTWYRVAVKVNLDAKTYDYAIYEMGQTAPSADAELPSVPTASYSGMTYKKSSVSQFAVWAYSFGKSYNPALAFDNIRISTIANGETNLVYSNTFTTRTRYGVSTVEEEGLLGDELNENVGGLDGWLRRGANDKGIYGGRFAVRNVGDDPAVTFNDEFDIAYAQHDLGRAVKHGTLTFRVDMRPPQRSTSHSSMIGRMMVGGDEFAQGEVGTYAGANGVTLRSFTEAMAGYFGFVRGTAAADALGYFTEFSLAANDGETKYVENGTIKDEARNNWYRFVAVFDLDARTWGLTVYNQGTSRPTLDAKNGDLVGALDGLSFKYADPMGLSAFAITAGGSAGSKSLEGDSMGLLIDNVQVTRDPPGTAIILR